MANCPLCNQPNVEHDFEVLEGQHDNLDKYDCQCCLHFEFHHGLTHHVQGLSLSDRSLLSGLVRERSKMGIPISITVNDPGEIEALIKSAPKRVHDKAMKLLAAIEQETIFFGDFVTLNPAIHRSWAYAQNTEEFLAFRNYLIERGFVRPREEDLIYETTITADGFAELEKRQQSNLDSDKAFVAMWFSDKKFPMKRIYEEHIEPGIRRAGYEAVRIDYVEHNGDVVAAILASIKQARFVIADFTGQRTAVYYETGFALGLGREIVLMCHKNKFKKCSFDTNHINHILWLPDEDDLSQRITNRIVGSPIGQGPLDPDRPPD